MAAPSTKDSLASDLLPSPCAPSPSRPPSHHMTNGHYLNNIGCTALNMGSSCGTSISTPATFISSRSNVEAKLKDPNSYIALGCLHFATPITINASSRAGWSELLHSDLPEEIKQIIGSEATRLLDARWIRMFSHQPNSNYERPQSEGTGPFQEKLSSIVRVYLLPDDWGRRFIDRNSKSLKKALRELLPRIDISPEAWFGDYSESSVQLFDPWATSENLSLFYLFNKLPSPSPAPQKIKNRFSRRAVEDILESANILPLDGYDEQALEGLKSRLYPYQARSASLMIQREAAPQLQLDPRLEVRTSPNGENYFFSARNGSFFQEPQFFETTRGGILAETMGLGKTIICLSVILATKGHMPQIPAVYHPPARIRSRTGSLMDMAASTLSRYAIPAKAVLERYETLENIDLSNQKKALSRNRTHYDIPADLPRMNRNTIIPPPRQLVTSSGTIVVVPRNLLHQWQSEIRKHVIEGSLKILVVDTISKRSKSKVPRLDDQVDFCSDLPGPTDLMEYDIVLITRTRFEQEIQDGADEKGRREFSGASLSCQCPYIGASRIRDCSCKGTIYKSPLRKIHWLRIIIDEGHSFSSSVSNAVLVAKQLQAERRWVVSGTPAKNLVGVEVDHTALGDDIADPVLLREFAIEQRKVFNLDDENTKAAKALGALVSNFLMVRPWSDSTADGKLNWEEYIYRHEDIYQKTYSGFSSCFLRTLEGLVVKTRPSDVEKDILLPPMRHSVVYIKPCWFDKMTANLFIQVLRANAITSERSDVDYLFHKNSIKARHSLIRNLRQSNFTWTGFSLEDVESTLETSGKYLNKDDKTCSVEDASLLLESSSIVATLTTSESWIALSKAHEVGLAIDNWPEDSEESFSLAYPEKPAMIGVTQLLDGQLHVDSHILAGQPLEGLDSVGWLSKANLDERAETETQKKKTQIVGDGQMQKAGVPSSCVGGQPLTSRRSATITTKTSPVKPKAPSQSIKPTVVTDETTGTPADSVKNTKVDESASRSRPRKRKPTHSDEVAELEEDSPLRNTRVVGTTSAKLSYLIDKVMRHQATEKIIIFYDGDNAAFYIAQCLEMLYVNHRIYARTLDNTKRSEYVALFNEDPDIRVLLIDVACGALGLNLNAASVVLIVNPINRPGIEAQAIKRAHRIGQTREVHAETLVLEGTIEEEIFKRAKKMSRQQHLEAKELEDDAGIVDIIQNAEVIPVEPGESAGSAKFAPLLNPQQVFGRSNRHKYHRFGRPIERTDKPKKRPKIRLSVKGGTPEDLTQDTNSTEPSRGVMQPREPNAVGDNEISSIFGMGNMG